MVESTAELLARVETKADSESKKADRALQESEERYHLLFEQSPIGISITTPDGIIIDSNKTMHAILGYSKEELKKINAADLYEKPEQRNALLEATKRYGASSDFSVRLKRKDGTSFDALMNVSQIHIRGKNLLQTTLQDITKLKKIEEMIRQSEEKYRNLFENAQDVIITHDLRGRISATNKAIEEYGLRQDQLIGKNILKFVSKKYWPKLVKQLSDIAQGNPTEGEIEVITPTGKRNAEYRSSPVRQEGKVIGVQTVIRDITERKKAEEAIRESEEKFKSIFESAADGLVYLDRLGSILDINRKALEIFGGARDELLGKNFTRIGIFSHKEILTLARNFAGILRGKTILLNVTIKNKNGQTISTECSASLLRINDKTMIAAVIRDVTERKKAELAILEGRERFESLFVKNPEATAHVDSKFEVLDVNPRFTELFGYTKEEARGRTLDSLIVPDGKIEEAKELNKKAVKGYVYHDTMRKTKNGALVPISVSAAPIVVQGMITGYVAVYKDIAHLKKTEEALTVMNEKLRVVGGLTRHDARNKLSLVTTNAYLAKRRLAENSEVRDYLEEIGAAVNDVVGIFDFAKIYEMLGVEKPTYIDVENTVNDVVSLFPTLKTVRVTNNCHGLKVLADSLLRQAFYNLVDDSLKYAQNLTQIKVYYERADNDHLKIIYKDNGAGIPFDKKPKLFQKGFTTGKGSGYGLYLIQKMMEIYGWTIEETGEPGKGARFVMKIPKFNKEGTKLYCLNTKVRVPLA